MTTVRAPTTFPLTIGTVSSTPRGVSRETATRYFDALRDGDVPLELLFSGTVFYTAPDGRLQTARLSWDLEAEYRLPVAVWRAAIDHHFPGTAWLRLDRESHDRLVAYKSRRALPMWAAVMDELLPEDRA